MKTKQRDKWYAYDAQGYILTPNIVVKDTGDNVTIVGNRAYPTHELIYSEDGDRIDHVGGAWYLLRG